MKLVGYKKGVSKKGNPYCAMHVCGECTPSEKVNGFVGQKTEVIFLPDNLVDMLKPSDIGHDLICDYTVSGGRAFLDNVTIK